MRSTERRCDGLIAAAIMATVMLGFAGIARAGIPIGVVNLDRSDLLDVWGYPYCDKKEDCPYNGLRAVWAGEQRVYGYSSDSETWYPYHTEVGIAGAWGYVQGYGPAILFRLSWFLYEPDKVTRNSSQVGMNQSDEIGFVFSWQSTDGGFIPYSAYITVADTIQGCAGSVGVFHSGDDAKWKVQCRSRISEIADALGLPANTQSNLADALGKLWNKPLRVRGQGPRRLFD